MEMKLGFVKEKAVKLELEEKRVVECKCKELEERCRKAEEKCLILGLEVGRTKVENEALKTVIAALKMEKLGVEKELKSLKRENEEKVDLKKKREEEDRVLKLTIENNALESEKKRAEEEVELWKKKFKEMESLALMKKKEEDQVDLKNKREEENRVLKLTIENNALESEKKKAEEEVEQWKKKFKEMESMALMKKEDPVLSENGFEVNNSMDFSGSLQESGTPYNETTHECLTSVKKQKSDGHVNREMDYVEDIQKNVVLEEDKQHMKKTTPATSSSAAPAPINIINVLDSDDEDDLAKMKTPCAIDRTIVREKKSQGNDEQHCGETINSSKENVSVVSASKRKRPAKVVTTDVDNDIDDNALISDLMKKPRHLEVVSDQASSKVKDCPVIATPVQSPLLPCTKGEKEKCTSKGILDENSKELKSYNDNDSLSRTIVDDGKLKDVSRNSDNQEIKNMCLIQRNKNGQSKWKFENEGIMLAAFTRDAVLCMKAVCALYRQLTKEKKVQRGTNQQGFNQNDEFRASALAKFLTGGDPQSDVKKSVKELREFDREGVDVCRKLAIRYSTQLFEIYEKKEDPYFLP